MKTIELKCPCCQSKLHLLINETGGITLQSFDLYETKKLEQVDCENFGLEFGEKGGHSFGKR